MRIDQLNLLSDLSLLDRIPQGKLMINTINTYSYTVARRDAEFRQALLDSDVLLPDGVGIVWATRFFKKDGPKKRITGWDLFEHEMNRLNATGGKCFFMGCSEQTLSKIKEAAAQRYPAITVETYSPPYKDRFTDEDNAAMTKAINDANPDLLWIGMSAPKQEKWLAQNWDKLHIHCHAGSIGAVFSFFAGTEKRAPQSWCNHGFEWLYRFLHDPKRLWPRYITGNLKFAAILSNELFTRRANAESQSAL